MGVEGCCIKGGWGRGGGEGEGGEEEEEGEEHCWLLWMGLEGVDLWLLY